MPGGPGGPSLPLSPRGPIGPYKMNKIYYNKTYFNIYFGPYACHKYKINDVDYKL